MGRKLHVEVKASLSLWGCLQLLEEMEVEAAMEGDKVGSSGSRDGCFYSLHIYLILFLDFPNECGSCQPLET